MWKTFLLFVFIFYHQVAQAQTRSLQDEEQCSSMDYVIDRHLTDFSEALESVLDEQNAFEMLRGEDEDNFIFVQGCDTIEEDLKVITCEKLREKNRGIVRNCFRLHLVGTPFSYCIKRKLNAGNLRHPCVKTYLKWTKHDEVKHLLNNNPTCLINGFKKLCDEETGKFVEDNLYKIKYVNGIY